MTLGHVAFLGSGETSLAGGRIFEALARLTPAPLRISILETPAGFELNAARVAGRVADFLASRLQNYKPVIDLIPARKRGTEFSPDNPAILQPLLHANLIFMGPGSPTYLTRQLRDTLAWDIIRARHRRGATLVFSSAATISVGRFILPVYEIFKAGEDVYVKDGLNFFSDFGLDLSFIPHWNNAEGGADLDTSRCFVGVERFEQWRELLPAESAVVGLDEHSGIVVDCEAGQCEVHGVGSVTILKNDAVKVYPAGATFSLTDLGFSGKIENAAERVNPVVAEMLRAADLEGETPPAEINSLLESRQRARAEKNFAEADRLRGEISARGWVIQDSPTGQLLKKK